MAQVQAAMPLAETAVASYFEVHVRRADRWVIDCTCANAAEARAEAADIARKPDVLGVKVVNERYNPRTEQSAARVVFKVEKPERRPRSGFVRVAAASRPVAAAAPPARPLPEAAWDTAPAASAPSGGALELPTQPAPWLLFAWASLALAVTASLLFLFLLVVA